MNTRRRAAFLTEILTLAIDCFNRFEPTFVHGIIIGARSGIASKKSLEMKFFLLTGIADLGIIEFEMWAASSEHHISVTVSRALEKNQGFF